MNKAFLTIIISLLVLQPNYVVADAQPSDSDSHPQILTSELSFRRYTTADGLPQMQAEMVWQDSRGYIYIGTLSGFVRYDGRTFTPLLKGRRENIVGFMEEDSRVSALSFRRRWIDEGEKAVPLPYDCHNYWYLNNFNAYDLPNGMLLFEDKNETQRRLCQVTSDGMKIVLRGPLLDLMTPDRKFFVDSSAYFVPTPRGLYKVARNQHAEQKSSRTRLISSRPNIFSLTRDRGKLYAFASDGIYLVANNGLKPIVSFRFDAPDYGLLVRRSRDGSFFISDSHSIYRWKDGCIATLVTGVNMIKNIFVDRWDRLWAATYEGVYCYFQRNFVNHKLAEKGDIVRALAVDGHDRVVMGSLNGKLMIGDSLLLVDDASLFFQPNAVALADKVYMVGRGDVASVGESSMKWENLPPDRYQFVSKWRGRLVVANRSTLFFCNSETSSLDTIASGIEHPWVAREDKQGALWVGASSGLWKITANNSHLSTPYYTPPYSLPPYSSTPYSSPLASQKLIVTSMTTDEIGNIYFSSSDSLFVVHDGDVMELSSQIPQLAGHEIRSLHVSPKGFLVIAVVDGLFVCRLSSHDIILSDIRFFNHLNGFTMVEPLMASMAEQSDGTIWLAGVEEMTSFSPERLLEYAQEDTIIPLPLRWWQHWWVWLSLLALLVIVIWWIATRYAERRHRRTLDNLQREKTQKDLQISAIRLKSIPHFHTNILAGIEYFVMNNSADEAMRYLKLYSDFTNQTLSDIDLPARTVAEEVDYIKTYLQLEHLRLGDKLTYSIEVDSDVDRKCLIPNMLLHTYCQNAIKHGISNRPEGGRVEVTITNLEREHAIVVSVRDNGVGRREAARLNADTTKQGLRILLDQIELYNQTNKHAIRQEVSDMLDEDGKPAGTCYSMTIPTDYRYE